MGAVTSAALPNDLGDCRALLCFSTMLCVTRGRNAACTRVTDNTPCFPHLQNDDKGNDFFCAEQ